MARPPALRLALATLLLGAALAPARADDARVKALFLGDDGHHQPAKRASELMSPLAKAGIDLAYTDDLADLNPSNLGRYDALVIYANHTEIRPEQEEALLAFVEGGKGLVVLHCGSYCFLNSPKYVALVGGQFLRHGGEVFAPVIDQPDHPALKGVEPYSAWDETYEHTKLTDDRDVLMHRDAGDGREEPWTWTRAQGKGRVFYTASGHDERVFGLPEYHRLVINGIKWAARKGDDFALPELTYQDAGADIPHYQAGARGGQGKPTREMQAPLSPEDSEKHLSVPGGFKVEPFAAEPKIVKPICLTWDERGRLWIAESLDYPNEKKPSGQGRDRITICEDTDGDGQADAFKTFAEGLSIPTSMVKVPGGLIVTQAPEVLFLADKDGDDRADEKRVLFSGFSTSDTHAGPSNLRLGFDGWVYGTVGYAGFRGTVGGQDFRFGQNLFRFKPDGSKLEVLTSTSNNTWGLGLTETNEVVYSTANGEHSSYLGMPNRYFEAVRGWLGKGNDRMADHDRMHPLTSIRQVDWFGGFTAAAGHAVYTARQFPEAFWNRAAFVCEPTGHLVHLCLLDHEGSGLVSRDRFNILASTDEWTSPIVAEVGPDGALWVIDWYNYIVQHNPTPLGFKTGRGNAYETPLRDKTHGRIYRLVNESRPLGEVLDLANATPAQLVETLKNDNMFWRMQAQWALLAGGDAGLAGPLIELALDAKPDATGESPAAIHALWTLKGLGALEAFGPREAGLFAASMKSPSPGVRRAALDVMPRSGDAAASILEGGALDDAAPLVRRAALLALAECPESDAAGAAIAATLARPDNAKDRWLPLAATAAAARHAPGFLGAALAAKEGPEALQDAVRVVAEHFARGEAAEAAPALLAGLPEAPPAVADAFLAGLAAGWPADRPPTLDATAQDALIAAMGTLGSEGQLRLATLAGRWGLADRFEDAMRDLRAGLAGEVGDAGRPEADRIAAASRLAQLNPDADALAAILDPINAKATPALAAGLLNAVGGATADEVAPLVVERWGRFTPALRRQAIELLLKRSEWTGTLLGALEDGTIGVADLAIDQANRLAAHPDKSIAERAGTLLAQGGRIPSPDRQKVLDGLLPITQEAGDAAHGREVFEKNCAKCHQHGDLGAQIGPNLTGFNVHPKDKILTEIIDPNRSVEGNYRQYTVATGDGQVFNGLLASETRTAIKLVDSEAKEHVVLRDDIDEMIASSKSLMPEGFETQITPADLADLLEFLTAKGKYVPLPLDKVADVVTTKGMFYDRDSLIERLVFRDWSAKVFEGVPFLLIDPQGDRVPNAVMLNSPNGPFAPALPKSVTIPAHVRARAIHLLGGVSGWGFPYGPEGSTSLIVRLRYADGQTEDHPLKNGVHLADYIRRVDVPGSKFAFDLAGRQVRYLAIEPKRGDVPLAEIELVKGRDETAPVVMAVTVETP
jgi:putative membrane-bound dehydrogenase-like protein